ncbi:MAG: hypothetical protein ACJAZS_000058 [Alteromonas naphthalenivorans]|jgi:hypothetical protein
MKALLKLFTITFFTLTTIHANIIQETYKSVDTNSRQSIPSFHYMRGVSKADFRKAGDTTLVETFTIENPGTYTLVQDIGFDGQNNVANDGQSCAIYIKSNNVVLDLGGFTLYSNDTTGHTNTSTQKAIDIQRNRHNVSIKNGNISGFVDAGIFVRRQCNNVRIQDMTIGNCLKNGIVFAGTPNTAITDSNQISNCTIDNITVAETTGITSAEDAYGLKLFNCYNIVVKDSSFGYANAGSLAVPKDSYGALVVSGTNIIFNNCDASGNYGNNAYGFKLSGTTASEVSTGCQFINCTANGNNAIIANTAYDSTKGVCYAFSGSTVRACTWNNCTASGNEATQTAHGFFYSNAQYCETFECTALNNRGGNSGLSNLHGARGCYSITGTGNLWRDCVTKGQSVSSQAPAATMAVGIELDAEYFSLVQGCESSNNGSDAALQWGVGINLRNTLVSPSFFCTIDNCRVTNNKSNTASQGAGIRDVAATPRTFVTNCFTFNNGIGTTMNNYALTGVSKIGPATYNSMSGSFTDQLLPYINIDIKIT